MRPIENYCLFLRGSHTYLDMYSDEPNSLAATFDIANQLKSLSIVEDSVQNRQRFAKITRRAHPKRRTQFGDVARIVAGIESGGFDRIRIADVSDYTSMRVALLDALRLASDDTVILVDRCDRPAVVDVVFQALATSLIEPATLADWRHNVGQMLVRKYRPDSAEPSRKTIVVCVVGEKARAEWSISRQSISAYAARIGAELVVFDEDLAAEQIPICKLMALERVRERGRVLTIDTDMVIREACPDLFAITPSDANALFCESFCVDSTVDIQRIRENYGVELATAGYANTGLMLLTERAVARLAISGSDAPIYLGPRYEQDYVNATFQKEDFKISPLSALVNCIVEITPFLKDTAFILHFAGASNANSDRSVFVETIEPQSSRYIRAKSNLGNIFLRLLLLRNAIYAEFRPVDILLAAHQFATPHGQLVATGNVTRVDCSNTPGCVVFGPYITLEAGYYLIDILLDLQSYQSAFSSTAQRDLDCVEGSVAVDIVSNLGLRTIVEKKIQAFSCSSLSIGFRLNERTEQVECRLSEPSRPFSFYGMRIRSVDKHQRNEMVDIDLADPRSAAAICKQALGFRLADLQAVRRHCLPRPLIVTLTSHRRRFPGLASALKCLLSQSMRPDQVVLWLAPSDHKDLPNEVLELQTRGLTINSTEDIGPYTKIVPAFLAYPDAFIICADDDKYYPRDWLAELVDAWIPDERVLLCHRAHRMRFDAAGSLLPYVQWEWEIDAPETGSDLFATGCGGILFTPGLIPADAWDQEVFLRICATANDVWINCMAIKFGCLIRKVGGLFRVPDLPDTQEVGRAHRNLGGANDDQMRAVLQHYRIELHKGLH